jgi:hypothetical protein
MRYPSKFLRRPVIAVSWRLRLALLKDAKLDVSQVPAK